MQDIALVGMFVILALSFAMIWIWFAGRMYTGKLRNAIAQDLRSRFHTVTSKISVRLLGSRGAKFALHPNPESPFPKLEATIILLDRSNAPFLLYCKLRHRTDKLEIRASLRTNPSVRLEMARLAEKKRLEEALAERPGHPEKLRIDSLADRFHIITYTPEAAQALLGDEQLRRDLQAVAPYLVRLSIGPREPHLFISAVLIPKAMTPVENFTLSVAKALTPRTKKK